MNINYLGVIFITLAAVSLPAADVLAIGGKDGIWRVPLRYWYHENAFHARAGFSYLTEVTETGPPRRTVKKSTKED